MKSVFAVRPYVHPSYLNFKLPPYETWESCIRDEGLEVRDYIASPLYPWRFLHSFAFRWELPSLKWLTVNGYKLWCRLWRKEYKQTAMLMFVEPVSISFDTFPYYATHEIIPFIWDCWPRYYDKMEKWLRKHKVRTAIFTSSMEMEAMKRRVPEIKYIHCPEAVDTSLYNAGKELKDRTIDLLEFGRSNENVLGKNFSPTKGDRGGFNHVCTKVGDKFIYTNEQLYEAMGDAKITICLPKSMTHPEIAEGVETLTQRYWEAMLSRMIIVGHCPKELEELIGYNPVISPSSSHIDDVNYRDLITDIFEHIGDYQKLADRNREVALKIGVWKFRMKDIRQKLTSFGYRI